MSETTKRDLNALREGLRLVEAERQAHEDRARMARVETTAEMERRQASAYAAVAAVVRRELEAPATGDVRGRITRASIMPIEDEETMIAGLRAGAEAVERGELDADDFVGIWSQYLRELFRRASSVHAPADARELAREIIRSLDMIARNYDSYEYGLPVMTHYDEMVDTVVALLRTPAAPADGSARGVLWDEVYEIVLDAMDEAHGPDGTLENAAMYADRILALLRAPRGEGEEDDGEFCDLCGEMFDPRESGTVIGPLGQDDGVPRWYRCPRCARAYDAGYQQGQRDPRGDETADRSALVMAYDAVERRLHEWASGGGVQATHYEGCDADHPRCAALTVLRRLAEMRERLRRQTGNSMDHPPTAGI